MKLELTAKEAEVLARVLDTAIETFDIKREKRDEYYLLKNIVNELEYYIEPENRQILKNY